MVCADVLHVKRVLHDGQATAHCFTALTAVGTCQQKSGHKPLPLPKLSQHKHKSCDDRLEWLRLDIMGQQLCPLTCACAEVLPPIPGTVNVRTAENLKVGNNGIALYSADGSLVASTGRLPE